MGPTAQEIALDSQIDAVSNTIDLTLINPTNADEIKSSYTGDDPAFSYLPRANSSQVEAHLKTLLFPATPAGKLLENKQRYLRSKLELIRETGNKQFTALSTRLHPYPSQQLVSRAKELLEDRPREDTKKIPLQDAYDQLQNVFVQLNVPWQVQRMQMIASASVMPSKRTLYLKEKTLFSKRFIDRLKIHEIGTHAVRAENGRLQPLKIFMHGCANYLATEEGLAVFNEEKFGLLDTNVLRTYAGRMIAVDLAKNHTFSEVVEALQAYFTRKKSITIALRVKRGVAHGSEHGGYTKDTAYLDGYFALKKYEAQGKDFTPLYYGKVGLGDLSTLKELPWLVTPKYFPEMIDLT